MPGQPTGSELVEHSEFVIEKRTDERESWNDDGDDLPAGWEDWTEEEMRVREPTEDVNWSDFETSRIVGYRNRVCLRELGDVEVEAVCDTGRASSVLLLNDAVSFPEVPGPVVEEGGDRYAELAIEMVGLRVHARVRLEHSEDETRLILGRDVLGQGWVVDVAMSIGDGKDYSTAS